MQLRPSENTRLFGMDKYFNELINLYSLKKLPNKILLSGKKGLGKSTLAYHLVNYIFSQNEDYKYDYNNFQINKENRSFKLVQNNSHTNFYLIDLVDEKKNIDISQVREMINYTNKSSFDNQPRFILIDKIENLNKNSVNALLKIIEEPNNGIFFILINNCEKKILPTLKSRCIVFRIHFTFNQSINVANQLFEKNILESINTDIINYYTTPGKLIDLLNIAKEKKIDLLNYNLKSLINLFIDKAYYKKNKTIKDMMIEFIELFFLKTYKLDNTKNSILSSYQKFILKINNSDKFNLDEESLFLEFKSKQLNG